MSLKDFSERFTATWEKGDEPNTFHLHLSERRDCTENFYYRTRLIPHLTERNANPKCSKHWLYCKHLCLWLLPCTSIRELLPESEETSTEQELQAYWILD